MRLDVFRELPPPDSPAIIEATMENSTPRIDIIHPAPDSEVFLRTVLEPLEMQAQDAPCRIERLIVDDGSADAEEPVNAETPGA